MFSNTVFTIFVNTDFSSVSVRCIKEKVIDLGRCIAFASRRGEQMPRKGRKISRWCNRPNINRAIFYCYGRRYIAGSDSMSKEWTVLRRDAPRKCTRAAQRWLAGIVPLFLSAVTAITRLRTVIDNAYLGLRGLLNAFGIRFPVQCSKHSASEHKIIPPHSIQPCSINRFDQQIAFHGDRRTIRHNC